MNPVLDDLTQKLTRLVLPLLDDKGLELVEVNCLRQGRGFLFQLFIDKPQGSISLSECTWVNKRLSEILEQQPLNEDDYWLEVSSPGLDRELKSAKDFLRVRGKKIHFYLKEPFAGKQEFEGVLKEVNNHEVVIEKINNPDFVIPLHVIHKGLQVI